MRPRNAALARVASKLTDRPPQDVRYVNATVLSVAVGAGSDGGDVITVQLGADSVPVPHLAAYTSPAAGHLVSVRLVNGSPLIEGRVVGLPTF